ncbi:hypothetical protein YC2023_034261 [Brassica napus]
MVPEHGDTVTRMPAKLPEVGHFCSRRSDRRDRTLRRNSAALQAMKAQWTRFPENWKGVDPCGNNWVGISCYNNKVVSM